MLRGSPLFFGCCLLGCSSNLSVAVEHLDAGRLPEAVQTLRAAEAELPGLPAKERLKYALYRGLTHFALGDVRAAERWLAPVKQALDRDPRSLSDAERGRLFSAWRSMGHMPGESGAVSGD
jgi:hypothetical protein